MKSQYTIEYLAYNNIKLEEGNPNKMTQKQKQALSKSIDERGLLKPLIIDQKNILIDGHHRFECLVEKKWDKIPCLRIKTKNYADRKKMQIIANKLHGKDDNKLLAKAYKEILDDNSLDDLAFMTSNSSESMKLLIEKQLKITLEKAPSEPVEKLKIKSKVGDLYMLGPHILLCGDAFDDDCVSLVCKYTDDKNTILHVSPNMIFTDPPYDLDLYNYLDQFINHDEIEIFVINKDKGHRDLMKLYGNYLVENHIMRFNSPVSYANQPMISHRVIAHFRKGKSQFQNHKDAFGTVHDVVLNRRGPIKHAKPLKFVKDFITHYSKENHRILDFFAGAGTTIFAAYETGRICHAIELNPVHVDYILQRWYEKTGIKPKLVKY